LSYGSAMGSIRLPLPPRKLPAARVKGHIDKLLTMQDSTLSARRPLGRVPACGNQQQLSAFP